MKELFILTQVIAFLAFCVGLHRGIRVVRANVKLQARGVDISKTAVKYSWYEGVGFVGLVWLIITFCM